MHIELICRRRASKSAVLLIIARTKDSVELRDDSWRRASKDALIPPIIAIILTDINNKSVIAASK